MASNLRSLSLLLLFFLLSAASALPEPEIEAMLAAMRSRGYTLFPNAIATSDLYSELLSAAGDSFTFFAPTDSSVFALDMTASATDYVAAIRRHIVPRRLSLSTLRSIPTGAYLRTLEPRHSIHVQRRLVSDDITVDGVDVVLPGLFYSTSVAVHGLGGIISLRSQSTAPRHQHHLPPHPPPNFSSDHSISVPPVTGPEQSSPASSPEMTGHPSASPASSFVVPASAPADYVAAPAPLMEETQLPPLRSMEREEMVNCPVTASETVLGHVIVQRGNTFTLQQPTLMCPNS